MPALDMAVVGGFEVDFFARVQAETRLDNLHSRRFDPAPHLGGECVSR